MSWTTYYHTSTPLTWQGRTDSPPNACFFQCVNLLDLRKATTVEPHAFALIGFCCDVGIKRNLGRLGAKEGPSQIRQMLSPMAVPPHARPFYDVGDIRCDDDNLEQAQLALAAIVTQCLSLGMTPIVMGGGHELAFGHYQGIAAYRPKAPLAIVNFDAHFDMRPLLPDKQGSSGTPFLQIAEASRAQKQPFDYYCLGIQPTGNTQLLFDTAKTHQVHVLQADEMQLSPHEATLFVKRILTSDKAIYLSLCLDVFASAYAPGVSAPQALGLTPWHVLPCIRQLAESGKVMSFDIAEMSPPFDIDHRTAKLAASFIHHFILYHQVPHV